MSRSSDERTDAQLIAAAAEDAAAFPSSTGVTRSRSTRGSATAWSGPRQASPPRRSRRHGLSRRRFRDERGGSALPWPLGIAHNVLRASVRADRIERRARERLGLPLELAADVAYDAVERRLSPRLPLSEALATLPEHERDALEPRIVDELPYDAVAKRLDIRPAAARLRVSRALRGLSLATSAEDL